MNRREREEFARIERELMGDPSFGSGVKLDRVFPVPFRAARAAMISGAAMGATPLAVELGFLPIALATTSVSLVWLIRCLRLLGVASRMEPGAEGLRMLPAMLAGALFVGSASLVLAVLVLLG